jgi:transposase-like protein
MKHNPSIDLDSIYQRDAAKEIISPLIKKIAERCLHIELDYHLKNSNLNNPNKKNRKNGYTKKKIKSLFGNFKLNSPRDRNGSFHPLFIKKNQTNITSNDLDKNILYMLSSDIGRPNIRSYLEEIYQQHDNLAELISDFIIKENNSLQSKEVAKSYSIIWLESITCKNKDSLETSIKYYYLLGVSANNTKELLGVYSDKYARQEAWKDIFLDLKNRGMQSVISAYTDNDSKILEYISQIFPNVELHQESLV